MKTKFILHGGFTPKNTNEDLSDFYREMLKDAPESGKVLIVPFAKDAERVVPASERVKGELNDSKEQKNLTIEVANEENFVEQMKSADVIYFQGGKTLRLLEVLKKFPNLESLLQGKVVAGDSAGANVFGKLFYSPSANGVFEGLGILPLKIIPHYEEEYKDVFKDQGEDLEPLYLREYEYKVFNLPQE
jgi:peptidase E